MFTTPPAYTPIVTIAEAKAYFRILHDDENTTIERVIRSATEEAEQITNRALVAGEYRGQCGWAPRIVLPMTPFGSVVSVTYATASGTAALTHTLREDAIYERATLISDRPADLVDGDRAITITYQAGYPATPEQIKQFILVEAQTAFEVRHLDRREGEIADSSRSHYHHLLDSYRVIPI